MPYPMSQLLKLLPLFFFGATGRSRTDNHLFTKQEHCHCATVARTALGRLLSVIALLALG